MHRLICADCLEYLRSSNETWTTIVADGLCGPPHNGSSVAQAVMWLSLFHCGIFAFC
jgi:hypothetical protein